ncbi:hypothetical protein N7478_001143 [Penicillium angulare]|uniref:uncharacterized protein n=1 Tax=Penicillium angulare TaxID=116970 RepID=UPI002541A9CF|nr:uncharacterized protein N7478_001143 [Penicillium angulare]KAJ5291892.1 hypothetical protein N7478_001143 [Penicillium angulare]
MRLLSRRFRKARPSILFLVILLFAIIARVSAETASDKTTDTVADAQTTDDRSTTESTPSVTSSTESTTESTSSTTSTSEKSTSTTSESSTTSTTMDSTTTTSSTSSSTTSSTSSSSTSTSSDSTTTTSSVSTTTTSTSSSSTTTAAAVVTVPPTVGAPYLQTSNTPEGTVFIAVGAILGFIALAVLAWRGMVAWSVNRSVRRAAMAQSAESKRLLRHSRKKRSTAVYSAAPAMDVSLDKLGTATRASYKPSRRVPSNSSGLFYSPTAGNAGGSNPNVNAAGANRNSSYLPAGFYAATGTSTPTRDSINPHAGMVSPPNYAASSPSLPPTGGYQDNPHNSRQSYAAASSSSLNLNQNQAQGGRAPSAYLEDLFENHTSPRNSEYGRR